MFTDKDLHKLKEWWEKEFGDGWYCQECGINQDFDIPALIARLEAAEIVCNSSFENPHNDLYETLEAWRKSAGK